MIDFACPICGEKYQSDESHIGKQIRCRTCEKIIMISPQDGRYTFTDSQIQPERKPQSSKFRRNLLRQKRVIRGNRRWKRSIKLLSAALVLASIGFVGYYLGVKRNSHTSASPANSGDIFDKISASSSYENDRAKGNSISESPQSAQDGFQPDGDAAEPLPPKGWHLDGVPGAICTR